MQSTLVPLTLNVTLSITISDISSELEFVERENRRTVSWKGTVSKLTTPVGRTTDEIVMSGV